MCAVSGVVHRQNVQIEHFLLSKSICWSFAKKRDSAMEGAESAYAALSDLLICVVLDEAMVLKMFRAPYYIMGDLWVRTPNVGTVTREPGKKKNRPHTFWRKVKAWCGCCVSRYDSSKRQTQKHRDPDETRKSKTQGRMPNYVAFSAFIVLLLCTPVFVCRLCAFTATFRLFLQCPRLVSLKTRTRLCDFTHLQLSATRNPAKYRQFTQTIHN